MRWSKIKRRGDGLSPLRLIRYEACALRSVHGGRLSQLCPPTTPQRSSAVAWHRPCCGTGHDIPPKQAPYIQTSLQKEKQAESHASRLSRTHDHYLPAATGLDLLDLTAIVGTALRAHSVRQMQRTALGASHQTGSRQLPHGAASLVASLLGYFSLGTAMLTPPWS